MHTMLVTLQVLDYEYTILIVLTSINFSFIISAFFMCNAADFLTQYLLSGLFAAGKV